MKRLDIDFRVNNTCADYSCKIFCRCSTIEQLRAAKDAIDKYIETKISESQEDKTNG